MKKYILLQNKIVHEIIDEVDPNFPDVPIEARYSAKFLKDCVEVDEKNMPKIGDVYEDGVFSTPPPPIVAVKSKQEQISDIEEQITLLQSRLQDISK